MLIFSALLHNKESRSLGAACHVDTLAAQAGQWVCVKSKVQAKLTYALRGRFGPA
jgi:hypothetical protein